MTLKEGCPGCNRKWGEGEGQCSRCKRCLACCDKTSVPYSCGHRHARLEALRPGHHQRSQAAYERWANNPNVLSKNRRIY